MSSFRMELLLLVLRARALHVLRAARGPHPAELTAEQALKELGEIFARYDAVVQHYLGGTSEADLTALNEQLEHITADLTLDPGDLLEALETTVRAPSPNATIVDFDAADLSPPARTMISHLIQIPIEIPNRYRELNIAGAGLSFTEYSAHANPLFRTAKAYRERLLAGELDADANQNNDLEFRLLLATSALASGFYSRIDELLATINANLNDNAPHV